MDITILSSVIYAILIFGTIILFAWILDNRIRKINKLNNKIMDKLPEKWYLKITEESLPFINKARNNQKDFNNFIGVSKSGYSCVFNYSFNSNEFLCGWDIEKAEKQEYTEISLDDFKRLVLKEKVETRFEKGKWYRYKSNYKEFYLLCKAFENDIFHAKSAIKVDGTWIAMEHEFEYDNIEDFGNEVPLSEIQQYLPANHPDLIVKEEFKEGDWITIEKSSNLENGCTGCPSGTFKVVLRASSHNGLLEENPGFYIQTGVSTTWRVSNKGVRKAFPHEIPQDKSDKIDMEAILEEAKMCYPIGTTVIGLDTPDISSNVNCNDKVVVSGNYRIQYKEDYITRNYDSIYCSPNVYLYNGGRWAKIISLPSTKKETIYQKLKELTKDWEPNVTKYSFGIHAKEFIFAGIGEYHETTDTLYDASGVGMLYSNGIYAEKVEAMSLIDTMKSYQIPYTKAIFDMSKFYVSGTDHINRTDFTVKVKQNNSVIKTPKPILLGNKVKKSSNQLIIIKNKNK